MNASIFQLTVVSFQTCLPLLSKAPSGLTKALIPPAVNQFFCQNQSSTIRMKIVTNLGYLQQE